MGFLPYVIIGFLTLTFASSLLGAALGAAGLTRARRKGPRGMHPFVPPFMMATLYAISLNILIDLEFGRRMIAPVDFRVLAVAAGLGVALATVIVARIGLARRILGAAYLATGITAFALPFVGSTTSWLQYMPGVMATFVPTALGLILGIVLCWDRRPRPRTVSGAV